jgi:hypothetical protein
MFTTSSKECLENHNDSTTIYWEQSYQAAASSFQLELRIQPSRRKLSILVLNYLVLSDITKALRQHKERITPLHLALVCPTQRVAQCSGNRHCHCITNLDVPASIRINRKQMFSFSLQFTNKFDCSKHRHILLLHWTIHPIVIRESLQPCVFTNS